MLPSDVRLAVYRVVQEGLTNVVKYAAGQPTVVRTSCRDDHIEVEVANAVAAVPLPACARRDLFGGRGLAVTRTLIGRFADRVRPATTAPATDPLGVLAPREREVDRVQAVVLAYRTGLIGTDG